MRLLAIEDEGELCALLCKALERDGFAVEPASNLAEARCSLAAVAYDAVILDLSLPDGDGMDLLREIRHSGTRLPILILTARDGPEDRVLGFNAGADDFLVKPCHMSTLVARVRALLRRPTVAEGLILQIGNLALDTVGRQIRVGAQDVSFTPQEISMLEFLMRQQGSVVVRETMEQNLYSQHRTLGSNALDVQVHRLRRRLQEAGATPVIHTVGGVGYLMSDHS